MHAKPFRLLGRVFHSAAYVVTFLNLSLTYALAQDWSAPMVNLAESWVTGVTDILKPICILAFLGYAAFCAVTRRFQPAEALIVVGSIGGVYFAADIVPTMMAS